MLVNSALTVLFATVPASAQTLNAWRKTVFGVGGSSEHWGENALDNNVDTYAKFIGVPNQLGILLNTWDHYQGFYVQSSGNYLTDYSVHAVGAAGQRLGLVGRVTGAKSNFSVINFYDDFGESLIWTDTMFLYIDGVHSYNTSNTTTTIINEIYPIYDGDTIVYPPGQTQSPRPSSSTSTPTPTPTPTPPSLPSAPGLVLNKWPTDSSTHPIPIGGAKASNLVDGDPSTGITEDLVTNLGYPGRFSTLFNRASNYAGYYILSGGPNILTDYYIMAQNTTTYEMFEVCRVKGATSTFTVCPFKNEAGQPFYNSYTIFIYPEAVANGGKSYTVQEIWPIWVGDTIAKQEDL